MKKNVFLIILLGLVHTVFSQSSLDSLRFIIPVGHGSVLNDVVFTDDNKYIITSSDDNSCKVWEISSGKLIRSFENHNKRVNGVDYNPIDNLILTYSEDGSICIWKLDQSAPLFKLNGHSENINKALFNPLKREVISVSDDDVLIVWDLNNGKIKKRIEAHGDDIIDLVINETEDWVVTFSRDGVFKIWQMSTWKCNYIGSHGNILSRLVKQNSKKDNIYFIKNDSCLVSFNINKRAIVSEVCNHNSSGILSYNISNNERYLAISDYNKSIHIFDCQYNQNEIYQFKAKEWALDISINNSETRCAFSIKNGDVIEIDLINKKLLYENKISEVSLEKIKYLANRNYFFVGDRLGKCWIIESVSGKIVHSLNNKTNAIKSINHFQRDSNLVISIANEYPRLFDCKNVNSHLLKEDSDFLLNSDFSLNENQFILFDNHKLVSYDILNKNKQFEINLNFNSIYRAGYNQKGNLIYVITNDKKIKFYESNNGLIYDSIMINTGYDYISCVTFSKNDSIVYVGTSEGAIYAFDSISKKELFYSQVTDEFINSIFLDSDYKNIVIVSDQEVFYGKINSLKFKSVLKPEYIMDSFYKDDKVYLSLLSGDVIEFNPQTNLLKSKLKAEFPITAFSPILKNNLIGLGFINGSVQFWNFNEGRLKFSLINLDKSEYIIKLQNAPYYMCSKEASKMLHYVTPSLKVIGFDQLDPVYNRPDIVLDSIGKYFGGADQELIANYRQSWEKRIDRLGLDKDKLGKGEISVPNAEIVGADEIAYESKEGKLEINVSANDPKYLLRRFNVFVNEVPLYSSTGISIAHLKKQVWDTTVSVPLSVGENKIQVSVMNELGLENFKYPTYVNYTPENDIVAKTHYIGIGVNEFKEPGHKLNYCVKDVRDLAKAFSSENKNIDTLLFTDKQVTRENILALKDYLNKTSVNDKVIISCSSHGLLDDSLNFYLAMYDVDFKHPQFKGLKYEDLEILLDGIPARQKLLLLDACNSGENDKTEVLKQELKQKEKSMDNTQLLAARGVVIQLEEENKNNFKKMNELFVNVRNNTGSVIISAAGGQESALEAIEVNGKAIENGAFTYSVLECLEQNKGKELKVNTLKQYTEKRVEEITKGKQKPTSRQETMEVDWNIFLH